MGCSVFGAMKVAEKSVVPLGHRVLITALSSRNKAAVTRHGNGAIPFQGRCATTGTAMRAWPSVQVG
jgi:hypothetical protein